MTFIALAVVALAVIIAVGALFTALYDRRVAGRYRPTGQFIEVGGLRLHYVDAGPPDGTSLGTIVLLHGASSNLTESMLGIGHLLADRYRVVALDRPGLGWSERGGGADVAMPAGQAHILAEALRRLGISNAVVVGHSWSGSVVPLFALDHADVAGAILVLSGVTHPWPGGDTVWYSRLVGSWAGWLLTRTFAVPLSLVLRTSVMGRVFSPQPVPPGFGEKAQIPLALRPGAVLANAEDIGALHAAVRQQSARYPHIRMPVTVIGGDADQIVWTDLHSRSFARDVPGARLVVLPDVGHMPQYARPDVVLSEIEALAGRIAVVPRAASR